VLQLSTIHLHTRPVKVLERRFLAILDMEPTSELSHRRTDVDVDLRICISPFFSSPGRPSRPRKRQTYSDIRYHSTRHSCARFQFHPTLCISYPDHFAAFSVNAICVLGSSMALYQSPDIWHYVGLLERSLGSDIDNTMGDVPSASLNLEHLQRLY